MTLGYGAHRKTVLRRLNDAMATEIVCVLRYCRRIRLPELRRAFMCATAPTGPPPAATLPS